MEEKKRSLEKRNFSEEMKAEKKTKRR